MLSAPTLKKKWTLEKYAIFHKEQHNILESLKDQGYTGIDQQYKVRYLSEDIKTTSLDSVKTCIISDESLCQDFDGCVTLYKDFVRQSITDDFQLLGIAASSTKMPVETRVLNSKKNTTTMT